MNLITFMLQVIGVLLRSSKRTEVPSLLPPQVPVLLKLKQKPPGTGEFIPCLVLPVQELQFQMQYGS